MSKEAEIKRFAQTTLGCGCPEEVFEIIECRSRVSVDGILIRERINIGNRLLIYVVEVGRSDSVENVIRALVDSGRKERDASGFNRFRLVLAAENVDMVQREADGIFRSVNDDQKVHLHIIGIEDIHF
ncbi:MAG TPA: hypothetical protein VK435_03995 [Thermodesulfovibrionales bacterium]|nr:hypothetical protein [Thermodesulfovibrionales bacterium]